MDAYHLALLPGVVEIQRFADVGGNIGSFVIALTERFANAQGVVYEPAADNFRSLQKTLEANLLKEQVRPVHAAVTGKPTDSIRLWFRPRATDSTSIFQQGEGRWETAPGVTLSEVLRDELDLLKIDTEGAEYEMILNTPPEVFERVKLLVLEYHEVENYSWKQLVEHLSSTSLKLVRHEDRLLWFGPWPV